VHPGAGSGEQLAQQVSTEEPGRPGEQYLARVAPVWRVARQSRVPVSPAGWCLAVADLEVEPGLTAEVDLGLVSVRAQSSRAGVLHRGREPAQCGITQQAAGKRAHRVS